MSKYYILLKSINNAYIWVVTRHQNGISTLVSWDAISRETALLARRNVGCFLASEKALHLGDLWKVTWEQHAKGVERHGEERLARVFSRGSQVMWRLLTHNRNIFTCTTFLIVLLKRPSSCEEGNSNSFYKKQTQETCYMLKLTVIIWLKILLVPQGFLWSCVVVQDRVEEPVQKKEIISKSNSREGTQQRRSDTEVNGNGNFLFISPPYPDMVINYSNPLEYGKKAQRNH